MSAAEQDTVLIAAGGTGGHLFPAQALSEALGARGYRVDLVTDARGGRFESGFPKERTHIVPAATVRGGGPLAYLRTAAILTGGLARAYGLIGRQKPRVVVGFGGYPTVPPLLAAAIRRVPSLIHEQNAVMGRANRMLAGRVDAIATSFPEVQLLAARNRHKVIQTGAPVRKAVIAAAAPYSAPGPRSRFRLMIFGGSQGARIFSEVVPAAIGRLDEKLRKRLTVVQQCRQEDLARVRETYRSIGIEAELAPFFDDLPQRISDCHLVISRSGASTVAELGVLGRPAILVPLPHAIDNDQLLNATALAHAKGAWLMPQASFTPHRLAEELATRMAEPGVLASAAEAARALGNPRAADALADAVEALAGGRSLSSLTEKSAPA
jgi:UDP-N-acetylglucosamine--N-acetylmuramyl-(pentapeptide) pyrophosphoryl-undecaprenol N-acetylglucosamine transferase